MMKPTSKGLDAQPERIEEALKEAYSQGLVDAGMLKQTILSEPRTMNIKMDVRVKIVERGAIEIQLYSEYSVLPQIVMNGLKNAIESVVVEHHQILLARV